MNLKAFFRGTLYVILLSFSIACSAQKNIAGKENSNNQQPDKYEAYLKKAEALKAKGDTVGALQNYDLAIKLNPDKSAAYQYKGFIHAQAGKYNEAVESLKKAIELKLENAEIFGRLGFSLARINKPAEAVTYLSKAISLDPTNLENYAHRAYAYIDMEHYDRAEQDYKLFLMKNPEDPIAWYNLSRAQYSQKKYEESITSLLKVNNLQPGYLDTYFWLGLSHAGKGDFTNALSWFDKAIEQKPNAGYLYFNRGIAKGRLNRNDFCPDFKKAVELGDKDALNMVDKYCK